MMENNKIMWCLERACDFVDQSDMNYNLIYIIGRLAVKVVCPPPPRSRGLTEIDTCIACPKK